MKEMLNDLRAIKQRFEFAAALERNAPTTAEPTSGSTPKPELGVERVTAEIKRHKRTVFTAAGFIIAIIHSPSRGL